ncbi:hypothetical protein SAMN02745216_00132, partial [Desulfatibacillum alkenivorans DSM 16219]
AAAEKNAAEEKAAKEAAEKAEAERKAAEEAAQAQYPPFEEAGAETAAAAGVLGKVQNSALAAYGSVLEGLDTVKRVVKSQPDLPKYPEVRMSLVILAVLMACVVFASFLNAGHYQFEQKARGVILKKGRFAPAGMKALVFMPGMVMPADAKEDYKAAEAAAITRDFFLNSYEESMAAPEPDAAAARAALVAAVPFSFTTENRKMIWGLINALDYNVLMTEAEAAINDEVAGQLKVAEEKLNKAAALAATEEEAAEAEALLERVEAMQKAMVAPEAMVAPKA